MDETKRSLIIIGGGITGLSAGITWALNQNVETHPVTIFEKQPYPGGYVTTYTRHGFSFDTSQIIPDITDILEYFGVSIPLKRFEGYSTRIFLVDTATQHIKKINIPTGFDALLQWLTDEFPAQSKQIKALIQNFQDLYNELFYLKMEPNLLQLISILFRCPNLVKNSKKTFRDYFKSFHIATPEIMDVFDIFAAFSGLPAERVAALFPIGALNSTMAGAYRPHHGFIEFPNKLKKRFVELGGEFRNKTEVKKIIIEKGIAKGVELSTGERILSNYVITTIDMKHAMTDLVGMPLLQSIDAQYAAKVQQTKMSASSINIALGLDGGLDLKSMGFDCGYNVLTTGRNTFETLYQSFDAQQFGFTKDCFHMGVICPYLTTGGKQNLIIRVVPVPMEDWADLHTHQYPLYEQKKETVSNFFIDLVETYMVPNLKNHILIKDVSTPATYARYSGSPTGSIYDMAPYPSNFGRSRLKMRTPIKGLFQPKFGHGIWASLQQGMQAVDMILNGKVMGGNSRYQPKQKRGSTI